MNNRAFVILLLAIGLYAGPAAALTPAVDVPAMIRSSDLIVVGRASGNLIERISAELFETFYLSVDRTLKGTSGTHPNRLIVRLKLSESGYDVGYGSVEREQYGLFFFRRSEPVGTYTAADPYHPALVAAPPNGNETSSSGNTLTNVAHELSRVLTTSPATLTNPRTGIQRLSGTTPDEQANNVYARAAAALKSVPYASSGSYLRAIAASDQLPAQLWAINCLLQAQDSDRLEVLKSQYLKSIAPLLIEPGPDQALAVSSLASSIEGHLNSSAAVPTLTILLRSSNREVRTAAASVLADIASPNVIVPLAELALNDPEQDVRYHAVRGLEKAIGTTGALPFFAKNEAEILRKWRTWAIANVR